MQRLLDCIKPTSAGPQYPSYCSIAISQQQTLAPINHVKKLMRRARSHRNNGPPTKPKVAAVGNTPATTPGANFSPSLRTAPVSQAQGMCKSMCTPLGNSPGLRESIDHPAPQPAVPLFASAVLVLVTAWFAGFQSISRSSTRSKPWKLLIIGVKQIDIGPLTASISSAHSPFPNATHRITRL